MYSRFYRFNLYKDFDEKVLPREANRVTNTFK